MAEFGNVVLGAAVILALWTLLGLPTAARLSAPPISWLWAPALGFAVHTSIALPLLGWIGMGRATVLAVTLVFAALALAACFLSRQPGVPASLSRPQSLWLVAGVAAAALLALAPATSVLPKVTGDGMTLSASIFDHAKVALIDEMIRAGVPPTNPFFNEVGAPEGVAYYYLWHFAAALVAVMTGLSGWEADAALTGFTAFASLLTMIGLVVRLGGRLPAAFIVVALAATASLRPLLEGLAPQATHAVIGRATGLGGWLFQIAWAPQHLASASCVVLAGLVLIEVARRDGWLAPAVLGLLVAAGFECSVWVGGIVFPLSATLIAPYLLWSLPTEQRRGCVLRILAAAALAIAICLPFLRDQVAAAAARAGGSPIVIAPVAVLGPFFDPVLRRILDVPAYWLVLLPVEFAAFYAAGLIGLFALLKDRAASAEDRQTMRVVGLMLAASLLAGWLLRSVVADNNDLGWRAVLPAILLLIVFSAMAISRWPLWPARLCAALSVVGALLTLPDALPLLREDFVASPKPDERLLAETPLMWQAVRRHTAPGDRIANNQRFLDDMTPWPANISWALLANRRSCYAGNELAIPFAPIPGTERAAVEAQFVRIFAGAPQADDIRQLADRFQCDVVVVTPQDGAWRRDPFTSGEFYRLVETRPDAWRIYRRTAVP
jgi:hypothetical protein